MHSCLGRPALARLGRHVYFVIACLYAKGVSPMKWLLQSKLTVQSFAPYVISLMLGSRLVSVITCAGDLRVSNSELAEGNRPFDEGGAVCDHDRLIESA